MMLLEVTLNHKYLYLARAMSLWVSHNPLSTQKIISWKNINHSVVVMKKQCVFYKEVARFLLYNKDKFRFVKH